MRSLSHPIGRRVLPALGAASLFLSLTACSSGGGGGSGDAVVPAVTAMPGTTTFVVAPLNVTLAATDNLDPDPSIYYTTDLTTPTAMSTAYTGPIALSVTTVLKSIAIDASGNASPVLVQGYTQVNNTLEMQWAASGHGDITGEPFRHWDEDGDVQTSCARCHGDGGLKDFAADGTVDNPGALPLGLFCSTCHTNPPFTIFDDPVTYPEVQNVMFPSGAAANLWSSNNICTTCHQGRSAGSDVDDDILANPGGPYGFTNIHYYAAGATYFGAETNGGYEYAGHEYAGRNVFPSHDLEQQTCVGCHMRGANFDHTFVPQVADCTTCHMGASFETLSGSPTTNFDAISTTQTELLALMKVYALLNIGTGLVYDGAGYPYFFKDSNSNGMIDAGENTFGNRYNLFDAPLVKAAYNYQVVAKEPAGYIHNGTYLRQLLHDSIADLGGTPGIPAPGRAGFDADNASRSEQWHLSGHANSVAEAFRHWDADPDVATSCARCHTTAGFVDFLADGTVDAPAVQGDLIECAACHQSTNLFANPATRYDDLVTNPELANVTFPSGATADFGGPSNLCMSCHQGRESGVSVDTNTANTVVQTPVDYNSYDFVNRHYFAAAAILFGSDVNAAYEYVGATYEGQNLFASHPPLLQNCVGCHMRGGQDHRFVPQLSNCSGCHLGIGDFEDVGLPFGMANVDYDGSGTGGSFQEEIDGQAANVLLEMQDYAMNGLPQASLIVYGPGSYPYWFQDTNADGLLTPGEDNFGNRYRDFDRALLRAAFNYHSAQDPCSDIHGYKYTLQTLYDSIDDLDDGVLNASAPGTRP